MKYLAEGDVIKFDKRRRRKNSPGVFAKNPYMPTERDRMMELIMHLDEALERGSEVSRITQNPDTKVAIKGIMKIIANAERLMKNRMVVLDELT